MSLQSISLPVPKVKKRRWGKPKPGESLKMLAAGSLAFAKAYSSVEKLEIELEAELERDKKNEKRKGINKWRRKGGKLLLTKYMLLFIVVLNIIDCTLVLGELIMDLHHVKDILFDSQQSSEEFIDQLKDQYPDQFSHIQNTELDEAYDRILQAQLFWPVLDTSENDSRISQQFSYAVTSDNNRSAVIVQSNDSLAEGAGATMQNGRSHVGRTRFNETLLNMSSIISSQTIGNSKTGSSKYEEVDKSVLKTVGFVFHKISLSISVILVLWVLLKIVCFGSALLHRRLEVFDTFVILTSFIVDMIFVKGLSMYTLKQFVYILAFMLPWRVIRVTNSLVVAVKDHEHFRLKMLFTQKKKIEHDNKQIRSERDSFKEQVEALKKLCLAEGIDDWKIFQSLARQQIRPGNKGAMGSFASLAFGAFGNKSTSFWSVLGTPKMRRGKSMEIVNNKVNAIDPTILNAKRHSKGKIFGFLGSSADYIRGKLKNGHHMSIDSDPGFASTFIKPTVNGHIGKRLVRGETIDTMSTDSIDEHHHSAQDDFSKQGTFDSSNCDDTGSISPLAETSKAMQRAQSDSGATRPPLQYSQRLRDVSPGGRGRRASSVGAMDSLTVDYHPNYSAMDSDEFMACRDDLDIEEEEE